MDTTREPGADPGDCRGHTGAHIRCTADDAKTPGGARVHITDAEPISVGMAVNADHSCNKNVGEGSCYAIETFDFQSRHCQPPAQLLGVGFHHHKFAKPAQREFHDAVSPDRN